MPIFRKSTHGRHRNQKGRERNQIPEIVLICVSKREAEEPDS